MTTQPNAIPLAKMSDINDGGPAFPKVPDEIRNGSSGMTLRDWFAGQIAAGLAANRSAFDTGTTREVEFIADTAFVIADAMLGARATTP